MNNENNQLQHTDPNKRGADANQPDCQVAKFSGISPYLSRQELAFVKATKAAKVSDLSQKDGEKAVMECMNRGYAELGQPLFGTSSEDRKHYLSAMAKLLLSDLLLYFPNVTIAEISLAIKKGIRREYGDYYGYNVISIHGFVEKYIESEERAAALDRQNRYRESLEVPDEPSLEDQSRILEQGLQQCLDTYRKTGRIIDFGNVNYQLLLDRGLINPTLDEKKVTFAMADWEIRREKETADLSLSKKLHLKRNPSDDKLEIIARAKELTLRKYFDELGEKQKEKHDGNPGKDPESKASC